MKTNITKAIYKKLHLKYPNIQSSLNFNNPVECWASVILSAQCTDKRVNSITKELFNKYKTFKDYSNANMDEIIRIIRPCGYFNTKSRYLILGATQLTNDGYTNTLPVKIEELMELPGIGKKTANVIYSNIYNYNHGIAIDTHNIRILNRLGIVQTRNPQKIEKEIMNFIPRKYWKEISLLLVKHGRDTCKARKPNCENCSIKEYCTFYKVKNDFNKKI